MGQEWQRHPLHYHNRNHPAVDNLQNLLTKANNELSAVHHRLEKEFQDTYPDNVVNPLKLVSRIKKIHDDLSSLKEQCRDLLAAKQDLIDNARTILVRNRSLLQRIQASADLPFASESDDAAYTNLNQIIDEWTAQTRLRTGDEKNDSDSEDINHLLFSAIVQDS